ncbi:Cystathionine gamma-lyase [Caloramator mitchellensis]|uniref:Cystathionine gamma-lyase n=1 Tax=Caloramator mitchellensis TaxID=908809 RepID=A0A0R3JY82_CALMK|nr:aminotransferase class I/II-fold pyridoxal phosphate-dependent enzyme [Caloramator mitchellensis]KRQ86174.1 Cystathionine gamma-lyase [Caloramator mitchellensis]
MKIESLLIHGGVDGDELTGAVNVPVYLTSTYKQELPGAHKGYEYSRTGNPTRFALEKLISDLEGGIMGFAFSSGMAAITSVFMLLNSDEEVIISNNVYGGTYRVLNKIFKNLGINYKLVNTSDLNDVRNSITDKTKMIFIETPTNPLLSISDIAEISKIAKEHSLLTVVDNTFMTPYFQRPISLGADIVVHSATKYLGGHSDLVAGLVVVNSDYLAEKIHFIQNSTGGVLDPFSSYLLIRGIKTLAVRMDRHEQNAKTIVDEIKNMTGIDKVYYPTLLDEKSISIHNKQSSGNGAIISFSINEKYDLKRFLQNLKVITLGESLGGVESLICHPATMTHASIPKEIRDSLGITENLVRLSVGIENVDDLLNDIKNALKEALI